MAKRVQDDTEADTETEHALPSAAVLKKLAKKVNALNGDMAKLRGDLSGAITTAERDHGVHKGAFKQALKIANLDEGRRESYITHLLGCLEAFGIDINAEPAQGDVETRQTRKRRVREAVGGNIAQFNENRRNGEADAVA